MVHCSSVYGTGSVTAMNLNKCTEYGMKNKTINSFSKRMGNNNIPLNTYYTRLYHNSNIGLFLVKHVVIWKTIVQSLISFKVFTRCNCKKLFLSIYNLRLQVKPNKDKLKWFLHVYLKLHLQKKIIINIYLTGLQSSCNDLCICLTVHLNNYI